MMNVKSSLGLEFQTHSLLLMILNQQAAVQNFLKQLLAVDVITVNVM